MIDKKDCFYIGSCRYMKFFPQHFPAKLHTTKEIINYLNNYNSIDLDMKNVNYVYGDILQPDCMEEVLDYCQNANSIFDKVNNIFMEITSRKYVLQGGGWYSNYYFNPNNDKNVSIVNDDELYSDLLHIKYLIGGVVKEALDYDFMLANLNIAGEKLDITEVCDSDYETVIKGENLYLNKFKTFPNNTDAESVYSLHNSSLSIIRRDGR